MSASQPHHTSAPGPSTGSDPDTATPNPAPTSGPVKPTERPHPLTPFVRGWLVFVAIAIGWGREIVSSAGENQFEPRGLVWILPVLAIVVLLAGIAGFFSWYFTRFVIDDEELRIDTGAIFKRSTKIPFERLQSVDIVQPLAARIFGLAELRLDAGNSTTKLRNLTRSKAAIPAQSPPATAPIARATTGFQWLFDRAGSNETPAAAAAPASSWPSAPMLNTPARKAIATDNPVRISGVARTSVADVIA